MADDKRSGCTMSGGLTSQKRAMALVLFSCVLTVASGCWKSGVETVPVRGRVTFNGGPCPAPGAVYFTPIKTSGDLPARPASGRFETDGEFTISSFHPGDGLVPGTYRARIECWQKRPDKIVGGGISHVPASYKPPDLVIESGTRSTVEVTYDIPAHK